MSFYCLVRARGKKCPYSPFKHQFHLNDHMGKTHLMVLSKIKPGPKVATKSKNGAIFFKGGQYKGDEFQSYVKFSKTGENYFWKKIQAMGDKNEGNVGEVGSKTY